MDVSGDAQATGPETVSADPVERLAQLLAEPGHSEEGEPLEDEPSEDSQESEVPEDAEPPEETDQPRFRVKVDGEEIEVTEDELLKGYSRQQDYTRKTMQLSEERQALAQERQAFTAEREKAINLLQALEQTLKAQEQPIDWEYLRQADPAEYAARRADEMERRGRLAAAEAERARLQQQQQAEAERFRQARIAEEEANLLKALPEWSNPETVQKEWPAIADYAQQIGVRPDEMEALALDHRLLVALRDAAQYRALKSKAGQIAPSIQRVTPARPGSGVVPTSLTQAKQRLAQSGRVEDAAELIFQRMKNRR